MIKSRKISIHRFIATTLFRVIKGRPHSSGNREFKQPRRRRQRERQKTIGFNDQNNDSARALDILVHFFAVLCKTTT